MKRRLTGILLLLTLLLSFAPRAKAAEAHAAKGELARLLLVSADSYQPGLSYDELTDGLERGDEGQLTRAEALVMISRAFGRLPSPKGHNANISLTELSLVGFPDWALEDAENLARGGALVGSGEGIIYAGEPVTLKEASAIISRIYALLGTNPKDDFYSAVNKSSLEGLVIKEGGSSAGTFASLAEQNNGRLEQIIKSTLTDKHEKGSPMQKISDLYRNILDLEGRNAAGTEPIRPYLDAIDTIETMEDFLALRRRLLEETGFSLLLGFDSQTDPSDSARHCLVLTAASPSLPRDYYLGGGEFREDYIGYLSRLLTLTGLDESGAAKSADMIYELEKKMALSMMERQEYSDISKIHNLYTMSGLSDLLGLDAAALLSDDGFAPEKQVCVFDPGLAEALARSLEGDIELLKAYSRLLVAAAFGPALSEDFQKAADLFSVSLLGVKGERPVEREAALRTHALMSEYLDKIYVEQYFSQEAKRDVEAMVDEFIEIYKARILELDWLSGSAKKKAILKLDNMKRKIGYPEKWSGYMDSVDILSGAEGGSYYHNLVEISKMTHRESVKRQYEAVDKDRWMMSAAAVNAYFSAQNNEIVFPAGILQAPFYDLKADKAENLGGIGFIIAHEITHCFDNNGSQFDERGVAANWWSKKDHAGFKALCEKAVSAYDGLEYAPGIVNNGTLTLSENIADLGAAACAAAAVSRLDEPDYKKLFESMAKCWVSTGSREYLDLLSRSDVHSADRWRVNRALQSLDIFYETYGIGPGDGMYLPPEARVSIW